MQPLKWLVWTSSHLFAAAARTIQCKASVDAREGKGREGKGREGKALLLWNQWGGVGTLATGLR
ncbi:hypothetical protein EYF80_007005 [Liparis tanakae]|uniref:Secreted protein n=1 Tax=Liparis tanakae TaxID=230148 RepID=A0A4Z2IYY9_9TELE|nr:hypothetical protein EYF80_007005 [Liparis tanakae]